jgi:protein TonB
MHRPCLSHAITAACTTLLIASLAGCGETQPPPAAAPAVATSPQTTAVESDPSAPNLVALGNAAFRADRLFDPPQDNAFDYFTAALAQNPDDAAAREALADIFPFALARVEAAIASGDLAEAGRLLDALDASFEASPALAALRRQLSASAAAATEPAPAISAVPASPDGIPAAGTVTPAPATVASSPGQVELAADASPESYALAASNERATDTTALAESPETSPSATPSSEPTGSSPPSSTQPATPPAPAEAPTVEPPTRDARLVRRVAPDYPALARQRRIEGWVDLEYVVGIDGQVIDVRVLDSDPPRVFDVTAERALRRWVFEPASRGGIPTQSMGRTRIEFSPG